MPHLLDRIDDRGRSNISIDDKNNNEKNSKCDNERNNTNNKNSNPGIFLALSTI